MGDSCGGGVFGWWWDCLASNCVVGRVYLSGARLRQKGKLSVYAEVRASETTALRALSCCKKIIALGVEALQQQERTVTFEETGRAERGK